MKSGFWRKCRLAIRWLRRLALVAVMALIVIVAWCNRIGIPDFLKKPLVEKLRDHGVELEFTRMRLHLKSGLVVENVRVGAMNSSNSPSLSLAEVQLQPDFRALLHGRLQIDGLGLRNGKFILPLSPSNLLTIQNIQSDLHFGANDTWSLDHFNANFQGAKIMLAGDIVHAPEMRNWEIFQNARPAGHGEWRERLTAFSAALRDARKAGEPQLQLVVKGDAGDPKSFIVNLIIAQGNSRLQMDGAKNDPWQNYRWRIRGSAEPEIARPFLLSSNAAQIFNHFAFDAPVTLDANIYGRLDAPETISADGHVALTNFTVRGEAIDNCAGEFFYTNRVLKFFKPHLARGAETMTADQIILDFSTRLIWFKNGFSTADPRAVARAISPKVGKLMNPYNFLQPPSVLVNGRVPLKDAEGIRDLDDADLTFEIVDGAPFECLKVRAQRVTGTVHWLGEELLLTNVTAQCYGGSGRGGAIFDFSIPGEGAQFQFNAVVSNLDLHGVIADLSSPTNHLRGLLSGEIIVNGGQTRDWQTTMDGYGRMRVRDGLLLDVPVIHILSPILNALEPGMGNIQATDANAKFTMTNGVIHSDALTIQATGMTLQYAGTVDLTGKVNANVTAQLMRDTPVVGPLIYLITSPFTKLFEYKVTGTLKNPKSFPLYVPKELFMPFHPIRSLEELLPANEFFNNTNAVSAK